MSADPENKVSPSQNVWNAFTDSLAAIGPRVANQAWNARSEQSQAETYRLLAMGIAQGFINYVYPDTEHPDWVPAYNTALNLLAPVPDFMYQVALINGDGAYRISGFRGTSRFVDISVFSSLPSLGGSGPILDRISLDSLSLGDDGSVDLVLSKEKPEGFSGDWRQLDPRAVRLQVRHACYDWLNEMDARLTIERLDRPVQKPRESAETIRHKLEALSTWAEKSVMWGIDQIARQRERGMVNTLQPHDFSSVGGYSATVQAYREGLFDISEDELLIIETEVPEECRYWSILVTDDQYSTINWIHRQSSINGHQACLDTDGKFRAVVSINDPGVPNWLDTGGYQQGAIQLRWNEASSQPVPSVIKVKYSALRDFLPAETPVITPAQRQEMLRLRRRGAQLRRKW